MLAAHASAATIVAAATLANRSPAFELTTRPAVRAVAGVPVAVTVTRVAVAPRRVTPVIAATLSRAAPDAESGYCA